MTGLYCSRLARRATACLAVLAALPLVSSICLGLTRLPALADFPAEATTAPSRPQRLAERIDHRHASRFRRQLESELDREANFAGHFRLVELGCGTDCRTLAIVDLDTGRVFVPKETEATVHGLRCATKVVLFAPDSRLLVLARSRGEATRVDFFVWDQRELRRIYSMTTSTSELCSRGLGRYVSRPSEN